MGGGSRRERCSQRLRGAFFDSRRVVVGEKAGGRREIRGGGEFWEHPIEIELRVHLEELAGAEDRIEHRGFPAGIGVADEEPATFAERTGPDAVFDGIIIDLDVAIAGFGKPAQRWPPRQRIRGGEPDAALR